MGTRGRLEARITVPTGGWSAAVDDSGGGGAVAATVPAGTYYLLSADLVGGGTQSLVAAFEAALNAAAPTDTLTVTVSAGEAGTGKTTIASSGSTSLAWTDTELRDLLGYEADLSAGTSWVSPRQCQALWLPDCPYDARNELDGSWWGEPESDFATARNSAGYVWGYAGESCEVLEGLAWNAVSRRKAIQANESTGHESWERFARQGIWGQAAWGTPTGPIRLYPDADDHATHGTYAVEEMRDVKLAHFSDGFAAGSRRIPMPRLVRVPGSDAASLAVPTDGPGGWFVPASASDFAALGLAVPDYLWLCQEPSGSLNSAIGSLALATNGSGHLYAQSIPGWSRTFVGTNGGTGQSWRTTSALLDLAAGESFAMLALASVTAPGSSATLFAPQGPNDRLQITATTGTLRSNHNTVVASGSVDQSGLTTVHQFCWYRNAALSQSGAMTDTDAVVGTHNTAARSGVVRSLGNEASSASPTARFGWVAMFKGANAERDWAAYLTALRG